MNKKGDAELLGMFIFIVVILGGIFGVGLLVASYSGGSSGSHYGYVTAVEYNRNIVWPATLVYFKTDTESTQEDVYCAKTQMIKGELENWARNGSRVKVSYSSDMFMFPWDCNGALAWIDSVENIK